MNQSFCSIPIFGFLCQPKKPEPNPTPKQKKPNPIPSAEVLTDLFNEITHLQQETNPKLAQISRILSTKTFDQKLTEKEKINLESDFEEAIKKMRQFKKVLTQISSNFNKKCFDFGSAEGVYDNFSMNHPQTFPNVATNITVINQPFKKEKLLSKHDVLDETRARRMSDPHYRQSQKKQLEKVVNEHSKKKWKKDVAEESDRSDVSELETANMIDDKVGEEDVDDKITPLNSPNRKTLRDNDEDDEDDDNDASETDDFEENSEAFSPNENRKRHGSLLRTASSNDWTINEIKAEEKSLTKQLHALHQELDER